MNDYPPFPGFREQAFTFLRDLARHNEREWFKKRKSIYEDELVWPMKCLIADAGRRSVLEGHALTGDPERGMFRIYRDTRFSKNKLPYKTHVGAVLSRSGDRRDPGGLYIHVEPDKSLLAVGFWLLDPKVIRRWRESIAGNPGAFLAMTNTLAARGLTLDDEESLKRMPRGYEHLAEEEIAGYLRLKSFYVTRYVQNAWLQEPSFTEMVVQMIRDAEPLLEYGWDLELQHS